MPSGRKRLGIGWVPWRGGGGFPPFQGISGGGGGGNASAPHAWNDYVLLFFQAQAPDLDGDSDQRVLVKFQKPGVSADVCLGGPGGGIAWGLGGCVVRVGLGLKGRASSPGQHRRTDDRRPHQLRSGRKCLGGPKIALRGGGGGDGMGARRRRGGGVPEMGFCAGPFVLCKDGCCHQRRRNTNFGPEIFFFTQKVSSTYV